ncbi:helix-turn-helix transcriptional regulator [Streptomyces capparidis]
MTEAADRVGRELSAVLGQGANGDELGEAVSRAVAPSVPHDAVTLVATSPAVGFGVPAFSFWHGVEPDIGRALMHRFYAGEGLCPPQALARRPVPVDIAHFGAGNAAAPGAREWPAEGTLAALGVGGELRLLLRDARGPWGMLGLLRSRGARPFGEADARRAARLVPALVSFLRGYVRQGPLVPTVPALPPGVVVLGADGAFRAGTPQVQPWDEQFRGRVPVPQWVGESFLTGLALYARRQSHRPRTAAPATLIGPAAVYGRWVACQAQPLDGDGRGDTAVVVHAAAGEHLLPSFCDWYGITAREREVVRHLREGTAPKQIARCLGVSGHTVNDHIKAVLRKTGADGRDGLLAAIS